MEFGQRLKYVRTNRGYTQKGLGDIIGVTEVTIGNWERGVKKPGLGALSELSKILNISLDALAGIDTPAVSNTCRMTGEEELLINKYRQLDRLGKKAINSICAIEFERTLGSKQKEKHYIRSTASEHNDSDRYIPFYTTPSAAGIAAPLEGEDFEMILADNAVPKNADFAVRIQGNSMYPFINDGDMVFVNKDSSLSVGDIGIFCVDGAMYCKQYYRGEDGTVYLLSANPDKAHTNIVLTPECGSFVSCCGKVIMKSIPLPDYFNE